MMRVLAFVSAVLWRLLCIAAIAFALIAATDGVRLL